MFIFSECIKIYVGLSSAPQMMKKIINKVSITHVIIFLTFFYLLFPTENSSLDAYLYASHIKFNENLFSPHHLLYNAFLYVLIYPIKQLYSNVDILLLSKHINSIFLLLNLIVFYKILSTFNLIKKEKEAQQLLNMIVTAETEYLDPYRERTGGKLCMK
jgi:hypothetical protein